MKISCSKNDLLMGLNIALRAVPSKSTLPILESFLFEAGERIKVVTNDNDMAIETFIEGSVLESGKIAIDARLFSDIVRKLPENEVLITSDINYKVKITCEDTEVHLNGHPADEFPDIPETTVQNIVTMSQFTLKELIRQTIFSISTADTNALMKGELFEIKDGFIKVVSLDSHRISIRKEKLAMDYGNARVVVPGKTLNEISRILSGEKAEQVEISFDKKFIRFSFDNTKVYSRLVEGEYFDVDRMISSDYETSVAVNKNDFLNNIDRAFTLSREGDKKPIVMTIGDEIMELDITSSLGSMNSRMDIIKEGKNLVIGFNPRFFIEALKVIDDEQVTIYFVNSNAPCFIKNSEENYMYIILPVNINR